MNLRKRLLKLKRGWKGALFRQWLALIVDLNRIQQQVSTIQLNLEMVEARISKLEEQWRGEG